MNYTRTDRVKLGEALDIVLNDIDKRKAYLLDHELTLNTDKQVKDLTELEQWFNYIYEEFSKC